MKRNNSVENLIFINKKIKATISINTHNDNIVDIQNNDLSNQKDDPINTNDTHENVLSNQNTTCIQSQCCVFDFDNTITGGMGNDTKIFHVWKVLYGQYDHNRDTSDWDDNSKKLIEKNFTVRGDNNPDIVLLKNAPHLIEHFMGGVERLEKIKNFLEQLSKKVPIYISSNGDVQIIYYFLVGAGLIQFITGIHGAIYGDRRRNGCLLTLPSENKDVINPFDSELCKTMHRKKEYFMKTLIKCNDIDKILFIDDNDEFIESNNIDVFRHTEFNPEGNGLTDNCCLFILNQF
jgi:hypothetical protein